MQLLGEKIIHQRICVLMQVVGLIATPEGKIHEYSTKDCAKRDPRSLSSDGIFALASNHVKKA